jgi:uncharacterized protein YdaU (DUF1376 family)
MIKWIDTQHVAEMATALTNDELGAAIRLLSRIATTGKPATAKRAPVICQVSSTEWEEIKEGVLEHFAMLDDGRIGHAILEAASLPEAERPAKARSGQTPDMPFHQLGQPSRQVPRHSAAGRPEPISIRKAAFDTAVRVFKNADQSESTARAAMSVFLKDWPEGDVYWAFDQADRQESLVDPRAWITACLKQRSKPNTRTSRFEHRGAPVAAPRAKKKEIATAENLGISSSTAENIRNKNRLLKLDIKRSENAQ